MEEEEEEEEDTKIDFNFKSSVRCQIRELKLE